MEITSGRDDFIEYPVCNWCNEDILLESDCVELANGMVHKKC